MSTRIAAAQNQGRPADGLLVAETFGPTVQGEGPSCGQQAVFIRLSRCNLSCPGCDTPYTWDWSRFDPHADARHVPAEELAGWALAQAPGLVVVTGGEPLLQQARLVPLAAALCRAGKRVEVETNGTVVPSSDLVANVTAFNVSPKLAGFAAPSDQGRRLCPAALAAFASCGRAVFKFVASGPDDLAEIDRLVAAFHLTPVWVMPEGTTTEQTTAVLREIADPVIAHGWNLTARLHVLAWGDVRGR